MCENHKKFTNNNVLSKYNITYITGNTPCIIISLYAYEAGEMLYKNFQNEICNKLLSSLVYWQLFSFQS